VFRKLNSSSRSVSYIEIAEGEETMAAESNSWFPLFEFQDWSYESFLTLPTDPEKAALPGTPVTAKKWAKGEFACGQAFKTAEGYTLDGMLSFRPGVGLSVAAHGANGNDGEPATFTATGTGVEGPTKGAVYELAGWVFPSEVRNGAARVVSIRGSVRAVRGPDVRPDVELGGMPLGTVGAFVITGRAQ
jgi:hypothetical protein